MSSSRSSFPVNLKPTEPVYIDHPSRLPVELLQQVFLLVIDDMPGCPCIFSLRRFNIVSLDVANPSLVFTRVCRLWRIVAHSTPGVWSRIQVALPGKVTPLKPFLPYFLQCWLARSGRLLLTICIVDESQYRKHFWKEPVENSRLLDILLSESQRWETVFMSPVLGWNPDFNTPRLTTWECNQSNLRRINAPKLSRLHINSRFDLPISMGHISCKDLRHIHLLATSALAICHIIASFPHLETIVVDRISAFLVVPDFIRGLVMLESMILPLPSFLPEDTQQELINLFGGLHLPMLRKLTIVGEPEQLQVDCLLEMLAVASFQVPVVDFQTDTPLSNVYMNNIALLLPIVKEVTFCGNSFQINGVSG
ncbi:hypothetical protein BDR04DRAFT_1231228 [Suillus decipiens]|nr:hypothetical protein BDR04DRAFT_1231228 [Suillus decipiens]